MGSRGEGMDGGGTAGSRGEEASSGTLVGEGDKVRASTCCSSSIVAGGVGVGISSFSKYKP